MLVFGIFWITNFPIFGIYLGVEEWVLVIFALIVFFFVSLYLFCVIGFSSPEQSLFYESIWWSKLVNFRIMYKLNCFFIIWVNVC